MCCVPSFFDQEMISHDSFAVPSKTSAKVGKGAWVRIVPPKVRVAPCAGKMLRRHKI